MSFYFLGLVASEKQKPSNPALPNLRHPHKPGQPRPLAAVPSFKRMGSTPATFLGFFLGFAFGVGCALAVMYSIYMGGYRAAVNDAHSRPHPSACSQTQAKALARHQPPIA